MLIVADTHVHLYPFYDLELALCSARDNLHRFLPQERQSASQAALVIFLTERFDCHVYEKLAESEMLGSLKIDRLESTLLRIGFQSGLPLYVVKGRQVNSRERLEVLALDTEVVLDDGLSVHDVLNQIRDAGGVPVLNWSIGKWMFQRGNIIEAIILQAEPQAFLVGDVAARPLGWGWPRLLELAKTRGHRCVVGSDPLPFQGEEVLIGTYAVLGELSGDIAQLGKALRAFLTSPDVCLRIVGCRDSLFGSARRLIKNRFMGRKPQRSKFAQ